MTEEPVDLTITELFANIDVGIWLVDISVTQDGKYKGITRTKMFPIEAIKEVVKKEGGSIEEYFEALSKKVENSLIETSANDGFNARCESRWAVLSSPRAQCPPDEPCAEIRKVFGELENQVK